jgi:hypothetical protein
VWVRDVTLVNPGEEIPGDPAIGAPLVRIADMGDEELDQTFGGAG